MINESRDLVDEIPSPSITKVIARATEFNNKNMYALQIGASLCYKLGQLCFITNQGKRCQKLGQIHYYKLGQVLLQIGAAIKNWGKMYFKLGQVLQFRVIITNWGITPHNSLKRKTNGNFNHGQLYLRCK